jgi:hypothetical protein
LAHLIAWRKHVEVRHYLDLPAEHPTLVDRVLEAPLYGRNTGQAL